MNGQDAHALLHFEHVATFRWKDGTYSLSWIEKVNRRTDTVYAFVQHSQVKYVGSAKPLGRRLASYLRRQVKGTSRRKRPVHALLQEALHAGDVDVLALPLLITCGSFKGLPVDLVLGIEEGLIFKLGPPWNRRGIKKAKKHAQDSPQTTLHVS